MVLHRVENKGLVGHYHCSAIIFHIHRFFCMQVLIYAPTSSFLSYKLRSLACTISLSLIPFVFLAAITTQVSLYFVRASQNVVHTNTRKILCLRHKLLPYP